MTHYDNFVETAKKDPFGLSFSEFDLYRTGFKKKTERTILIMCRIYYFRFS